jgi:DNA polymerase III gamma/tau subunit
MFEGISGHKKQTELLQKALERGKLAHAYVFAGPAGVGKKTIAKKLGMRMLEEGVAGSGERGDYFHPDFLEISSEDGIKIEQIRELIYKLSLKPYQAKHKVALIDNAEQLTNEAANALLKSLEEPKDYTYIFLITSNAHSLPKTILSRCQKINFGPLTEQERQSLNFVPDEAEVEETKAADEYFQIFNSQNLPERLIAAYEIADLEASTIKKILDAWSLKLESLLLLNPAKDLAGKIAALSQSRKLLDQNVNSKLLLTNLMLKT